MGEETREQIIQDLRKDGYTEYAINNVIDDLVLEYERQDLINSIDDKEQLQTLSAIRQAIKILDGYKISYTITYLLQTYSDKTVNTGINQRITNLQNKILKSFTS